MIPKVLAKYRATPNMLSSRALLEKVGKHDSTFRNALIPIGLVLYSRRGVSLMLSVESSINSLSSLDTL